MLAIVCISLFVTLVLVPLALAAPERYEESRVLSARKLLPHEMFTNKLFKIDERVVNDGYLNNYTVRSDYGTYLVRGTVDLHQRVAEIKALHYLEKNYPSTEVVGTAVGKKGKEMLLAPVRATEKLYDTVSSRDKLTKTVRSIPGGVANLFDMAGDALSDVADSVYESGKQAVGTSKSEGKSSGLSDAADFASDKFLDYVGYNSAFREIAHELSVDPYTENKPLRDEMKRVAGLRSAVSVGSKFAPGISLPLVGTANKYLGYAEKMALYDDPREIEKVNKKILETLGRENNRPGDQEASKKFSENPTYSPPMRKAILTAVQTLSEQKVQGAFYLLRAASSARTREVAELYVLAIRKLIAEDRANAKLEIVIEDEILPLAVDSKGTLIVPLSLDHVLWTEDVAQVFRNLRSSAEKKRRIQQIRVLVRGDVSPRFERELRKLGIQDLRKNVEFSFS